MNEIELDHAKRRAIHIFEKWNDVTGIFDLHGSPGYYAEILGVIEDAVEIGVQEALQDYRKLDSE